MKVISLDQNEPGMREVAAMTPEEVAEQLFGRRAEPPSMIAIVAVIFDATYEGRGVLLFAWREADQ